MTEDDLEILEEFLVEGNELLSDIESILVDGQRALGEGAELEKDLLDRMFRGMHTIKGTAGFLELAWVVRVTHDAENVLDALRNGEAAVSEEHIAVLCAATDYVRDAFVVIAAEHSDASTEAAAEDIRAQLAALSAQVGVNQKASLRAGKEPAPDNAAPEIEIPGGPAQASIGQAQDTQASIRVSVEKLDSLLDLVGELIIAENMVTNSPDVVGMELQHFSRASLQLNRITRGLQDLAMSVRMIPVRGTLRRLHRLVRDLGAKLGRQADLVLDGEDTEVDKTIAELVADPLVHILRNSMDHGLEAPAERKKAGKAERGTIRIHAFHEGGDVWITVSDDGRGLSRDVISRKAIERGLIASADGMTDTQVYRLIMEPGFSTASGVSDVSGRGVGMDVVRRNVQRLGGRLDVSSEPGQGTTISMRLPLTLAIVEGMEAEVGNRIYTIPMLSIRETFAYDEAGILTLVDGTETFNFRGRRLPLLRLAQLHGIERDAPGNAVVLVLDGEDTPFCLVVDRLLGQRQTVIKPLPRYIGTSTGVAGCSILSSGGISLVLDVHSLMPKGQRVAA